MKAKIEVGRDVNLEIIQHKTCKEKYIPFRMLGKLGYSQVRGGSSMDACEMMLEFSKPESWLMKIILRDGDDSTLQVVIRGKSLSTSERQKLSKGYKLLRGKDIIRRIKREYYMVNPMFLVPAKHRVALLCRYKSLK